MIRETRLFTLGLPPVPPATKFVMAAVDIHPNVEFRVAEASVSCVRVASFFRIHQHKEMK
jgi:hypothetical protein